MAPSTSTSSSFCCCTKYFTRRRHSSSNVTVPATDLAPIEIKVNGESQLTVPRVALVPRQKSSSSHVAITVDDEPMVEPDDVDLEFETARTSRQTDDTKLVKMSELFRKVRIEEGLEVTPRPKSPQNSAASTTVPPAKTTVTHAKSMRKAIFNEDGDITSRTIQEEQRVRKLSVSSLVSLPVIRLPSTPPKFQKSTRLGLTRKMSSAPQFITAFFALTLACVTSLLTAITNIFVRV
ncbi:unnamed protein product [Caenorhabditis angaria]|uniref:Uncharacterized protein n=1 Tax=Caenorhabditis angaria TaxID=860376 RepID=A0A9P1I5Z4_9PELO|nr:unnamed protein product [Caenorhabditis angaria]